MSAQRAKARAKQLEGAPPGTTLAPYASPEYESDIDEDFQSPQEQPTIAPTPSPTPNPTLPPTPHPTPAKKVLSVFPRLGATQRYPYSAAVSGGPYTGPGSKQLSKCLARRRVILIPDEMLFESFRFASCVVRRLSITIGCLDSGSLMGERGSISPPRDSVHRQSPSPLLNASTPNMLPPPPVNEPRPPPLPRRKFRQASATSHTLTILSPVRHTPADARGGGAHRVGPPPPPPSLLGAGWARAGWSCFDARRWGRGRG